jgi:hypothetical protein
MILVLRRQAVLAARLRVETGQLRRCLHAWKLLGGRPESQQPAWRRVHALLLRGLLQRCWREWRRQCSLRYWKVEVELRDRQIHQLGIQVCPAITSWRLGYGAPPCLCY